MVLLGLKLFMPLIRQLLIGTTLRPLLFHLLCKLFAKLIKYFLYFIFRNIFRFKLLLLLVNLALYFPKHLMPQNFRVWGPWQRCGVLLHLLKNLAIISLLVDQSLWLLAWGQVTLVLLNVSACARPSSGLQPDAIIHDWTLNLNG